jgi:hypothetical protein
MEQYALENKLSSSATYPLTNLKPYIRLTSGGNLPGCPGGGSYTKGATVTNAPTCSLSSASTFPHAMQ